MPSKLLIEAANAFHARHHFDAFGIRGASGLQLDLPAVLRRVRKLRDEFVASTIKATEGLGWRAIDGRARLLAANRIEVNGKVLAARKLILAPGSSPVVPEEWKRFGKRILTTDTLFERKTLARAWPSSAWVRWAWRLHRRWRGWDWRSPHWDAVRSWPACPTRMSPTHCGICLRKR